MTSREAFEKYEGGALERREDGQYRFWRAENDWILWQAAERQALERAAQRVENEFGLGSVADEIRALIEDASSVASKEGKS